MKSSHPELIPLDEQEKGVRRLAEPAGALDQRIKDRLQICRGASDDTQNLARRRLLLERLSHVAIARPQLLEQPHVLDGDDSLVGEGLEQRDLFVSEGPDLRSADPDHTQRDTFAQERYR